MHAGCSRQNSAAILVADDAPAICDLLRQILEREGYRVLSATNTRSAFELAQAFHYAIHLLIAELDIPSSSGVKLARQLIVDRPEMRVLLMSGRPVPAALEFPIIPKPFDIRAMLEKIKDTLHPGTESPEADK